MELGVNDAELQPFKWEILPDICKEYEDVMGLIADIFNLKESEQVKTNNKYTKLFNPGENIDALQGFRDSKEKLLVKLSNLEKDSTKKEIAKVFKEVSKSNYPNGLGQVLIYLSGLWVLPVKDFQGNDIGWGSFATRVRLGSVNQKNYKI